MTVKPGNGEANRLAVSLDFEKMKGRKMKLKSGFISREMAGENILLSVDGSFSGLVRSNQTAAFIVNCLAEEITEAEIIARLMAKYDAPEAIIAEDVRKILGILRGIGALDG